MKYHNWFEFLKRILRIWGTFFKEKKWDWKEDLDFVEIFGEDYNFEICSIDEEFERFDIAI